MASARYRIVIAIQSILALLLTWPLARHLTTHVPGNGVDDPALAWNLWWIKFRLVDQLNFDIFHMDWMFHPVQVNLAFYTLTPLNGLLSIPLQTGLSLVLANNFILLSSFILGGLGIYLLMLHLLSQHEKHTHSAHLAALFAAIVYAFASSKLFYAALGQFNIASSHWIPFCILYVVRIGSSPTPQQQRRNGLMAGLFLVFQAWSELTYASFLIIFIVIYFVWLLIENVKRPSFLEKLGLFVPFILMALTFIAGITPFLWAMLPDLQQNAAIFTQGGGFSDIFSADLMGYLLPTRLHPLIGDWVASLPFSNDVGQHIYLGYTVFALVIFSTIALIRRAQKSIALFWLGNLLFFWLLTLGPYLRWANENLPIPGPFTLLTQLPFFSGNRYPSRYSVMLMLCVSVLAGYGLWIILKEIGHRRERMNAGFSPFSSIRVRILLFLAIALLYIFEHASFPLPITDFRVPTIYEKVAAYSGDAYPGDATLLELPTGWRNGARVVGKLDALIMMQQWYQTTHGKQRLGGNTSRNPDSKFQYFIDAPLLGDLILLMNADRDHLQPVVQDQINHLIQKNRPYATQVLDQLGIQLVTVHVEKSPPALLQFVEQAMPLTLLDEWHGSDWTGAPSTIRLYEVKSPQSIVSEIDLADPQATLYLDDGWTWLADEMRYATQPQPQLMLDLPPEAQTLQLQLWSASNQVQIWLNGQRLIETALSHAKPEAGQWITMTIPAGTASSGIDRLKIDFGTQAIAPTVLIPSPNDNRWPIGKTGFSLPPDSAIVVRSAGDEVGSFAQIYVTTPSEHGSLTQDWSPNQRGYNLVALSAVGEVLGSANFDTNADGNAPMAQWLAQWEVGTIIAGAVDDEASYSLTEESVQALARLGVATDLRGKFRWSHAFIGVVGAPMGSAVEDIALLRSATVGVGAAVDGMAIYGGVQRVRVK